MAAAQSSKTSNLIVAARSARVNSNSDDLDVFMYGSAMRMAFSLWLEVVTLSSRVPGNSEDGGLEIIRTIRFFLAGRHDGQGVLQPSGGVAGARRECDDHQALGRCGRAAGAQDCRRPSQDPALPTCFESSTRGTSRAWT